MPHVIIDLNRNLQDLTRNIYVVRGNNTAMFTKKQKESAIMKHMENPQKCWFANQHVEISSWYEYYTVQATDQGNLRGHKRKNQKQWTLNSWSD